MKKLIFSDIHFGKSGNSQIKNKDCLEFVQFVCQYCRQQNDIDEIIFMGDWFDNRDSINVHTLHYSNMALKELTSLNIPIQFIVGNHDLFLKNSREITSLLVAKEFKNINVIDKPYFDGTDLYVPWLVGDEKLPLLIQEFNPRYVYGHFEIPSFHFNKTVIYDGVFNENEYKSQNLKKIFSGHFHVKEDKGNIIYIGNTHCLDMGDCDDEINKGITILDTDEDEYYQIPWADAPTYRKMNISQLLGYEDNFLKDLKKIYLQIVLDTNFADQKEEYREKLTSQYDIRNISFQASWFEDATQEVEDIEVKDFANVESLVIQYIKQMDTEVIRTERLVELFNMV